MQEDFKMIDMGKLDSDIDWIRTAMENPTYLNGKGDHSNMFELADDDEGYVQYAIEELEYRGYKVMRSGHFISLQKM